MNSRTQVVGTGSRTGATACTLHPVRPGEAGRGCREACREACRCPHATSAVDAERRRLADELHDVLGVRLVALMLQARALAGHPEDDVRRTAGDLDRLAQQTMTDVRRVVGALRSSRTWATAEVEHEDALTCLRAHLADVAATFPADRVRVHVVRTEPGAVLPLAVAWSVALVVSEGVVNAVKHGTGPVDVDVRLGSRVTVEITNDLPVAGHVTVLDSGGHGLAAMHRRVEEHGGSLDAAATTDGRFTLRAVLATSGEVARTDA